MIKTASTTHTRISGKGYLRPLKWLKMVQKSLEYILTMACSLTCLLMDIWENTVARTASLLKLLDTSHQLTEQSGRLFPMQTSLSKSLVPYTKVCLNILRESQLQVK